MVGDTCPLKLKRCPLLSCQAVGCQQHCFCPFCAEYNNGCIRKRDKGRSLCNTCRRKKCKPSMCRGCEMEGKPPQPGKCPNHCQCSCGCVRPSMEVRAGGKRRRYKCWQCNLNTCNSIFETTVSPEEQEEDVPAATPPSQPSSRTRQAIKSVGDGNGSSIEKAHMAAISSLSSPPARQQQMADFEAATTMSAAMFTTDMMDCGQPQEPNESESDCVSMEVDMPVDFQASSTMMSGLMHRQGMTYPWQFPASSSSSSPWGDFKPNTCDAKASASLLYEQESRERPLVSDMSPNSHQGSPIAECSSDYLSGHWDNQPRVYAYLRNKASQAFETGQMCGPEKLGVREGAIFIAYEDSIEHWNQDIEDNPNRNKDWKMAVMKEGAAFIIMLVQPVGTQGEPPATRDPVHPQATLEAIRQRHGALTRLIKEENLFGLDGSLPLVGICRREDLGRLLDLLMEELTRLKALSEGKTEVSSGCLVRCASYEEFAANPPALVYNDLRRHGIGIGVFESCGQSIAKLYYLEARVKEGGKGKITVECGEVEQSFIDGIRQAWRALLLSPSAPKRLVEVGRFENEYEAQRYLESIGMVVYVSDFGVLLRGGSGSALASVVMWAAISRQLLRRSNFLIQGRVGIDGRTHSVDKLATKVQPAATLATWQRQEEVDQLQQQQQQQQEQEEQPSPLLKQQEEGEDDDKEVPQPTYVVVPRDCVDEGGHLVDGPGALVRLPRDVLDLKLQSGEKALQFISASKQEELWDICCTGNQQGPGAVETRGPRSQRLRYPRSVTVASAVLLETSLKLQYIDVVIRPTSADKSDVEVFCDNEYTRHAAAQAVRATLQRWCGTTPCSCGRGNDVCLYNTWWSEVRARDDQALCVKGPVDVIVSFLNQPYEIGVDVGMAVATGVVACLISAGNKEPQRQSTIPENELLKGWVMMARVLPDSSRVVAHQSRALTASDIQTLLDCMADGKVTMVGCSWSLKPVVAALVRQHPDDLSQVLPIMRYYGGLRGLTKALAEKVTPATARPTQILKNTEEMIAKCLGKMRLPKDSSKEYLDNYWRNMTDYQAYSLLAFPNNPEHVQIFYQNYMLSYHESKFRRTGFDINPDQNERINIINILLQEAKDKCLAYYERQTK